MSSSNVSGVEVGEFHVCVKVMAVVDDVDQNVLKKNLPNYVVNSPLLILWSISRIKVSAVDTILGKVYTQWEALFEEPSTMVK